MSLVNYFSLLRPLNGLIAIIGVFTGFSIANGSFAFTTHLGLAFLAAFLINGAGNLINDYYDFDIDKKQGKNKTLTSGNVSRKKLRGLASALFLIGIMISYFINAQAFTIAILVSVLLYIYSAFMRDHKYIGNWVVASATSLTLIFGASLIQNYEIVFWLAGSAMFANVAREVIKDVEDAKTDKGTKTTLAIIIDPGKLKLIVLVEYMIAILIGFYVWANGLLTGIIFIVLLGVAAFLFFRSWRLLIYNKFKEAQQYSKYGMIIALLAFLGGMI